MNCSEVQLLLSDDVRNGARDDVQAHLQTCVACRALCSDLQALAGLTTELKGREGAPAHFVSRVCSGARQREIRRRQSVLFAGIAVAVLCAALVRLVEYNDQNVRDGFRARSSRDLPALTGSNSAGSHFETAGVTENTPYLPLADAAGPAGDRRNADEPLEVVVRGPAGSGYVIQLPATIEVRQTQAENEFYVRNVSH